jgi:F0F1-type ATP synthase delta subunit
MASAMLSPYIATLSDLKHIRRELEAVDEFLHQAGLRQGGKAVKMPTTSRMLDSLVADSKLNLLKKADREQLTKYVTLLIQKAPVVHITFASEPSASFLNKLVLWLRDNIHPQTVISVGLQPAITAGCVVRTANKQFDFSLRESFEKQGGKLMEVLKAEPVA